MRLDDVPSVPLHTGVCERSLPDGVCSLLDVLGAILNSPFVLAALGAAAGACAGAVIATRLVARRQRRDDLAAEIRSTNVATMVALAICHKVLSLKRTHVLPLTTKFNADMAAWNEFARQRRTGERQGNVPPPISIDLRTVPSLTFPIVTLQRLLFDKISMFGRALALMTTLSETAGWLTNANAKRNELVDQIRRLPNAAGVAQLYFGAPSSTGAANPEYPQAVGAVASHTDELIFFSATLANDLAAHAQQLRAAWVKEFGNKHVPETTAVDFSAARQNGLMPEDGKYAEWLAGLDRQIVTDLRGA
jgi:hypothetical protein